MTIKEEKKTLRQGMLLERSQLEPLLKAKYDQYICEQLLALIIEKNFKLVHAYIPMAHEIDITPLLVQLLQNNITVVCPKTLPKRQIENRILHSLQELEIGIKGTQHPANSQIYEGHYDLIIVPGLAFDAQKYRLGYGGGYYDNFLISHAQAHRVGIFYPFQEVSEVPREAHDVRLDEVIVGVLQI